MCFCHLTVVVPKPLPPEYPRELRTLGDHLRTQRLDRGLEQKQVAAILGVTVGTIIDWEAGRKEPKLSYIPAILRFLGYDPTPEGQTLGERLRNERRRRGLTQTELARKLHTRTTTVTVVEAGGEIKNERVLAAVRGFLGE